MRLLLDTHALVWYYQTDSKMSPAALLAIQDPTNEILVSPVNHWEVAIKLSVQKSMIRVSFGVFIQEAIIDNGFTILPIEPRHTALVASLPLHHRDPFDRLLIAQALAEGIPLLSADPALDAYGVRRLW